MSAPKVGGVEWSRILPHPASTLRTELHLACGAELVFFDPVNGIGMLWRSQHQVAQLTGPVTAPEFVRAMLARDVRLPQGSAMLAWSAAITEGHVVTPDASRFLEIASEIDRLAAAAVITGALH